MNVKCLVVLFSFPFVTLSGAEKKAVDASLMVLGKDRLWYFDLQRKPFTGKAESFHGNGDKKFTASYVDGKFDGEVSGWWSNGTPASKQAFALGKPKGISRLWHENGQLRKEANFKEGVLDGNATEWFDNGQLKELVAFIDGKRQGSKTATHEWNANFTMTRKMARTWSIQTKGPLFARRITPVAVFKARS